MDENNIVEDNRDEASRDEASRDETNRDEANRDQANREEHNRDEANKGAKRKRAQSPNNTTTESPATGHKTRSEWPVQTKGEVIGLVKGGKHTQDEIFEITGVPHRTQQSWVGEVLRGRTKQPGRGRTGRPSAIEASVVQQIIDHISQGDPHKPWQWIDLRDQFCPWVKCATTVKNQMNARGYYKCKACQRLYVHQDDPKRFEFCAQHIGEGNKVKRTTLAQEPEKDVHNAHNAHVPVEPLNPIDPMIEQGNVCMHGVHQPVY